MIKISRRYFLKLLSVTPLCIMPYSAYASKNKLPRKTLIMLDPGHGGKDPGAIGPKGTKEKDIVLKIAKQVRYYLKKKYHIDSLLTRENDTFINLEKRVKLAHKYNCTLFVSIHADGFTDPSVCGASVFTLSLKGATTSLEKYIEKTENSSNQDYSDFVYSDNKELNEVLLDMNQQYTLKRNVILGRCMLTSLEKKHTMHNHYCNSANFVVLRSPLIPSILIETAFITNPDDEKRLNHQQYRAKIARSISSGIAAFIQHDNASISN